MKIKVVEQSNIDFEVKEKVESIQSLKELILKYSFVVMIDCLSRNYLMKDIESYYLQYINNNFTNNRVKISNNKFYSSIFGKKSGDFKWTQRHKEHEDLIYKVVDKSYDCQKEEFIGNNRREMEIQKDRWILYFLKGPALNKRAFEFDKINSSTFRKEVKMYFKYKLWNETDFRNDRGIALITKSINILTDKFKDITYFKDITNTHRTYLLTVLQTEEVKSQFNKKLSVSSVRKSIQNVGLITDYLSGLDSYYNKPSYNYFKEVEFKNTSDMEEDTEIIPEEVIEQLDNHYSELNKEYRLVYEILRNTGLRIKEISHLKYDCLKICEEDENYYSLRYTPFKILASLKKQGLDEFGTTMVHKDLALKIFKNIEETKDRRENSKSNYIFIRKYSEKIKRTSLIQENSFVHAVNRLIRKHNIVDLNNNLWKFSSRQVRKTLAVKLAENGATSQEMANIFGHMNIRTTEKYYAELRKIKLAELNSKFFKKNFSMYVGEDSLKNFTEEERRHLYVDFMMNKREVELGQCSKHISEGPCGKRTGKVNCAICPKLCTGIKYINRWFQLRDSQKQIVDGLIKIYDKECIKEYEDFIEFKREMKLLTMYQEVINKILELGDE